MPAPALFLSYARDDAAAARRIAESLRGAGLEVWFDENELTGGDAWDQKIRTQIAECALFLPVISANTQARLEGYFRLEWRLAEQRSHLMAKGRRFLVPVCIDDTREKGAQVPEAFLEVQWTRIGAADSLAAFCERVKILLGGSEVARVSPGLRSLGEEGRPVSSDDTGQETRATKNRVPVAAWMALALTALVVVAASLWLRRPASEKSPPAELRRDASATTAAVAAKPPLDFAAAKSIAVLAFENVGGDKENEIFSDGVPEEILTQLGKVAGLRLAGRNSSFALRGRPEAEVAQKLNVIYVVSGSVQRVGSQVKITARLVNAADGMQLWQDRFTEDMKDIFAVQEKIAGLIAQNLSLKLGGAPRAAKAIDPEAQRLVLEGRYHLNLRTDEGFTRAEAAFAKAIALAPDFAEAHAGLAAVYVVRANFSEMDGNKDSANDLAHGRAAIERAVKLDASLAEAHAVLGLELMIERKLKESEQSSRHALALNPNSASAHFWRGNTLTCLGRIDLSIEEFRRSTALDPLWFINLVSMSFRLSDGALWSEALEVADRALALRPGIYIPALGARARALARLGRIAEAVETVRTMRQHLNSFPRWNVDAVGISILRQAGLGSEAADYAAQVLARKDLPVDSYLRGFVLGALGRFEEARPFLERTPAITTSSLLYDQMWDSWRESAGFRELIAKLGIVEEYKTARETLARMQRERAGKK